MDSGHLEPDESLDQEFDASMDLSAQQLIWLMDELSNREVRDLEPIAAVHLYLCR